ncbi:MAG: TIGR02253 family HAD-type hydrolase [Candidatus Pacearchaeota archaeon]
MIKAILFDLDNTLVDFMAMKKKSCEAAIDAMIASGLEIKRDEALKILFELYDKYGIEYQQIFQKFLEKTKGKVDYKILANGVIAYRKIREFYLSPYPRVIPTLIELKKKYTLAIITDAPRLQAWLRLVSMKIDSFFDIVITAADVRKKKITAAPFKAALKELKIKPEEAMMVGDWIDRDIKTAKSLGIKTCYARYGDEKPAPLGQSGADYEIEDIKDLIKIIF